MLPGERFRNWVDEVATGWADRLGRWTGTAIGAGIDVFAKILGKSAAPMLKPFIDKLEATGPIPPELKPLFDELREPTGEVAALLANSAGSSLLGSALGKVVDYYTRFIATAHSFLPGFVLPDISSLLSLWWRKKLDDSGLSTMLRHHGLGTTEQDIVKQLSEFRLDPTTIIRAWYKDKETYEKYFDDLRDQGWTPDRIDVLKFATLFYPPPADLVKWQAKEVFEPKMIEQYGLDSELGEIEREPFYKAGMDDEQIRNYWRAHWEHASYMQIRDMIHRGVLTPDKTMPAPPTTKEGWTARDAEGIKAAYDWYRLVEIPPFWRARLTEMMFEVPTRVDVRRFWDMRTIDEERLRSIYHARGYHGKDLDDYVLWTKVYVAFPDLMARWKNGWITLDEVKAELTALGMPTARLEDFIQMKVKATEPERVEEGRALTKTEIYKGIKKGLITWEEGIELLMDMGYDYDEADYLLSINVAVAAGSPETFAEFKELTQKYRLAAGMEAKPMPEEIKTAASMVVTLTGEVEALERSIAEEKRGLIEGEAIPEAATKRLKSLQVKRNRAISTLEKAKSEYDRLVAEWKHGLP